MRRSGPGALLAFALLSMAFALAGCKKAQQIETVAEFGSRQCAGVAVSAGGRIFVSFPRGSRDVDVSVAEVLADGSFVAYPDGAWNSWKPTDDPRQKFVSAESVWSDPIGGAETLWVLDAANPRLEGVVTNGAKLVRIDLATNQVTRNIRFESRYVPSESRLADVRVDAGRGFAYITDSGLGALLVADLNTGRCRRVLEGHVSTRAEAGLRPVIGGTAWDEADRNLARAHADGIALSADGEWLYFKATAARTLYRIATVKLRNFSMPDSLLAEGAESLGGSVVSGGMVMDRAGNLYVAALEKDAVVRRAPNGTMKTVIADPRLAWPHSLALSPEGDLYVTVSQMHLLPRSGAEDGLNRPPCRLFRAPRAAASPAEPK